MISYRQKKACESIIPQALSGILSLAIQGIGISKVKCWNMAI